ncbi:MAG TPA: hypothetical protein VEB68_07420 [Croceibacterium sp.]|nr:hypothetical protein [Croceibacterium sp.]
MFIRKALVALASAGLVFGSTAAAAAPAEVADVRAASPVGESENLGSWAWILLVVIIIGALGAIAADKGGNPTSP